MMLKDKTVVITGGGGGAGLGMALAFKARGALVTICDLDPGAVQSSRQLGLTAIVSDVSQESGVAALFALAEETHGPVEILINNVGISGPTAAVENVSRSDWDQTMAANVTSHFLCIRRAVPSMKTTASGCIVNISSGSAKVGLPMRVPYVVSKAAVLSLTRTLARELGPSGIRVNAILPGAIRGERIMRVIREKAAAIGVEEEEYERSLLRYISMRTMVDPEDIADMAIFLASPAGRRITGQCIGVDGNLEWEG